MRVPYDNRVKHAKPAGEQERSRQRKEQNKLECDGPWFVQERQRRVLASFENIANATNRMDQLRFERVVYFGA